MCMMSCVNNCFRQSLAVELVVGRSCGVKNTTSELNRDLDCAEIHYPSREIQKSTAYYLRNVYREKGCNLRLWTRPRVQLAHEARCTRAEQPVALQHSPQDCGVQCLARRQNQC